MTARKGTALVVATAGCVAGLTAFPRHTATAMLVAGALHVALSRRAALAALAVLLIVGALGLRPDLFPRDRPTHERAHGR
jgi:hypothetical protein